MAFDPIVEFESLHPAMAPKIMQAGKASLIGQD